MSDRICLMNNGHIEQIGAPSELYFHPRSVFVADFLGESNLLTGTILESGANAVVEGPGGLKIQAIANASLKRGEKVRLMERPESLRLMAREEDAANVAEGILKEIVFVGGVRRYYVALAGDVVVSVKRLTLADDNSKRTGDTVRIGWERQHTIMLGETKRGHQ